MRVVIAEDHYLVREGTRKLLEDYGEVEVVAAVGDTDSLLEAVDRLRPDAVVTDIRMPPGHQTEGIAAALAIREKHPDIGIVVLSQYANSRYAFELFRDGTAGLAYLLKDGSVRRRAAPRPTSGDQWRLRGRSSSGRRAPHAVATPGRLAARHSHRP